MASKTLAPEESDLKGFAAYMERFKKALLVTRAAITHYKGE